MRNHISLALLLVVTLSSVGCNRFQAVKATVKATNEATKTEATVAPVVVPVEIKAAEAPVENAPAAVAPEKATNAFLDIQPAKEFSPEFTAYWGPDANTVSNFVVNFEKTSGVKLNADQVKLVVDEVLPRYKTIAQSNFEEFGPYVGLAKTLTTIAAHSRDVAVVVLGETVAEAQARLAVNTINHGG